MNRVYKVIWSKAKHCYVVTSEIARSVTKSASSARSAGRKGAAVLAMAALLFTAGGMLGEAADSVVTDVTAGGTATVSTANVITITKDDLSSTSITIDNVEHAKAAETADKDGQGNSIADTYATKEDVENDYVKKTDAQVGTDGNYVKTAKKVGENLSALDTNLSALDTQVKKNTEAVVKVGQEAGKNFTDLYAKVQTNADAVAAEAAARKAADQNNLKVGDDGVISKVTGEDGTKPSAVTQLVLNKDGDNQITMDEKGIKVGKNSTVIASDGVFAGGDTATDAKAALNANGSIKGANGDFEVNGEGKVTAKGGVETDGAEIKTGGGSITAGKITGTELNTQGGAITGGMATVTGLTTQGGDISGGNITATGLNTQGGEINGGDITSSRTIHAAGKITGNGLDAGSGAINGGSLSVTGAMEGNSLTLKGGNLNAGSGTITTTGDIEGNNITAGGTITTKDLKVTGGLEMNHITLGSKPNNYTEIDSGNVTSKVLATDGGVIPIAESIFNKDGSSITVRTDEGAAVDSTGISKVGAKEISQYLGDNAEPESSQKNVTRNMVRNNDGTFSMEDKAVDGKNKTYTKQTAESLTSQIGDDGKVKSVMNADGITNNADGGTITNTAKNGTITNDAKDVFNKGTNSVINEVGNNQVAVTTESVKAVYGSDTSTTWDANGITSATSGDMKNNAKNITNTATKSITDKVGENVERTMGTKKIEEFVKDAEGNSNTATKTATKDINVVTDGTNTSTESQLAGSVNTSLKNGTQSLTNKKTVTEDVTKVTDNNTGAFSSSSQKADSITNTVKDGNGSNVATDKALSSESKLTSGNSVIDVIKSLDDATNPEITSSVTDGTNTTSVAQTAKDITNTAKNGTITNDANDVLNKGANSVINEVGDNKVAVKTDSVEAAYGSDTYTTWDDKGITSNTSGDMSNSATNITNSAKEKLSNSAADIENIASKSITDKVGDNVERTMTTEQIQDKVGKTTVTTTDGLTKLTDEDHNHTTEMDYANVTKDLSVERNTTLGKEGEDTNLTVNSKSEFKDTVKMDSTLEVDGESTFNNKVTITKGGLDVTGGTTTDTLEVKGTSEFGGNAAFKDDVSMGKNLTVTGKTETGTLHVNGDGYVGGTLHVNGDGYVDGDLNVKGNIETHDAELSADSRQVVTGRQLYQTNERVDRLDNRIKKVGANAAALAALRPGDFNPDDKFSIAAGFGSYRNASAAALGLFYRPNENVILSLGTSFGDGENMVNVGVSVKFGRGKSMAERRKEMAEEVSVMRDEMKSQNDRIAELEEMLKKQSELIEKLSKES